MQTWSDLQMHIFQSTNKIHLSADFSHHPFSHQAAFCSKLENSMAASTEQESIHRDTLRMQLKIGILFLLVLENNTYNILNLD